MRYGNDSILSGELDKIGKLRSKKRGFYELTGSILTRWKRKSKKEIDWELDICDGNVQPHGRNGVSIELAQTALLFYARNEESWRQWLNAFQLAARQKIENFYAILQPIGEGGFASVFRGTCRKTGAPVAIKTIDKGVSASKFLSREVAILKNCNSKFVVSTYDIFETPRHLHLVLELMEGGSLYDLIENAGKIPEESARDVMRQVLRGILYLQSQDIVHRDIKPENILLARAGDFTELKLADFGLSCYEESGVLMKTLIGTPQFSALEILRDEQYGREVDMWSAGILLYNLLTGTLPFSVDEVLSSYSGGDIVIPFPESSWGFVSHEAKQLTRQLLCKDQKVRLCPLGALCSPWISRNGEWDVVAALAETWRGEAEPAPVNTIGLRTSVRPKEQLPVNREAELLETAVSRQCKARWRAAACSVRFLARLGASLTPLATNDIAKLQSFRSSASSFADSEWDYSEADPGDLALSEVPSFESASSASGVTTSPCRGPDLDNFASDDISEECSKVIDRVRTRQKARNTRQSAFAVMSATETQKSGRGFHKNHQDQGKATPNEIGSPVSVADLEHSECEVPSSSGLKNGQVQPGTEVSGSESGKAHTRRHSDSVSPTEKNTSGFRGIRSLVRSGKTALLGMKETLKPSKE